MASKFKLSHAFAIKLLVVLLAFFTVFQKTCNCSRQLKKKNLILVTSIRCHEKDPSYIKITECILKAINRTHKIILGRAILLKTWSAHNLVHFRVMKKSNSGFQPFGIDVTLDSCQYMAGKKNIAFDWIYEIIFPYTNVNHTCPYDGVVIFNLPMKQLQFPSVFPEGEYRFELEFGTLGKMRVNISADLNLREI